MVKLNVGNIPFSVKPPIHDGRDYWQAVGVKAKTTFSQPALASTR